MKNRTDLQEIDKNVGTLFVVDEVRPVLFISALNLHYLRLLG